MHGAILQLTNMPSLRGAQLERSTGTTLICELIGWRPLSVVQISDTGLPTTRSLLVKVIVPQKNEKSIERKFSAWKIWYGKHFYCLLNVCLFHVLTLKTASYLSFVTGPGQPASSYGKGRMVVPLSGKNSVKIHSNICC